MQQNPASPRTRNRARLPQALILLMLIILACNLPGGVGSPDASSEPAPLTSPAVNIQEPAPGVSMTVGETFDFLATATDEAGVTQLDLFIDGTAVLSQTSPDANGLTTLSLMYPMVATTPGSYALIARAYNSKGESRDSALHYVTVSDANASTQEYAQYVVQEGDTLENIAQRAGVSVDSILQANPHLSAGQVLNPGQAILIPMGPQPPVQAAVPAPGGGAQPVGQPVNQPGGQAGGGQPPANSPGNQPPANPPAGIPGIFPGILPVFLPLPGGNAGVPGLAPIGPNLFPVGNAGNIPAGGLNAPGNVTATANGCQITLSWTDNSTDETGYNIYRFDPGNPASSRVAQLSANITKFQNNLAQSGKYGYEIEVVKQTGANTVRAVGAPVFVDVTASANCPGGPKRVMFQPVSFQPKGLGYGFLNVSIGGFSAVRYPYVSQKYYPAGSWEQEGDISYRLAIPLPQLQTMKSGDSLNVEIQGNGAASRDDNAEIIPLGQVVNSHTYETLVAPDAKDKVWEARTENMVVAYKIWLEDWHWGQTADNNNLPPPWNIKLAEDPDFHLLSWSYYYGLDPWGQYDRMDGFIVYAAYDCGVGGGIIKTQHIADDSSEKFYFKRFEEPVGCSASYWVTAFNSKGESKPSDVVSGMTLTASESVQVIFDSVMVNALPQPVSASITLSANGSALVSPNLLYEAGRVVDLGKVAFKGGNQMPVNFNAKSSRSIQITFSIANLCQGQQALVLNDALRKSLEQGYSTTIQSPDGNCVLSLSLKKGSPPNNSPSLKADRQACTLNDQCQSGNCQEGYCAPATRGAQGVSCFANSQCTSGLCQCLAPNGGEIPCPSLSVSPPQPGYCVGFGFEGYGQACERASDCASFNCVNNACVPKNGLGQSREYCNNDSQCASDFCLCTEGYDGKNCKRKPNSLDPVPGYCIVDQSAAKNGSDCQRNNECQSNYCADGNICAPRDGTGLAGDYCHHNNQCFSGSCNCPTGTDVFGFCIDWYSSYPRSARTCNP